MARCHCPWMKDACKLGVCMGHLAWAIALLHFFFLFFFWCSVLFSSAHLLCWWGFPMAEVALFSASSAQGPLAGLQSWLSRETTHHYPQNWVARQKIFFLSLLVIIILSIQLTAKTKPKSNKQNPPNSKSY